MVKAPLSGLPVPAEPDILVEGEIPSPEEETVHEGPFGEWPGYYSHSGSVGPEGRAMGHVHPHQPRHLLNLLHDTWTSDLAPRLTPEQKQSGNFTMGRVLVDACKPFNWKESFPEPNVFSPAEKRAVAERWAELVAEISGWSRR